MRRLLAAAGLVLVAGMTTACGGSPDDASEKDFCKIIQDVPIGDDGKVKQDDWDDWIDELKDTGTPESISDDGRDGFESSLEVLEGLDIEKDSEDIGKEMEEAEDDLDDDEKDNIEKFDEYVSETCAPAPGG